MSEQGRDETARERERVLGVRLCLPEEAARWQARPSDQAVALSPGLKVALALALCLAPGAIAAVLFGRRLLAWLLP
ncbi:hypothetical protein [Alkalilimnicola sp. S0819]|uniref:hypothetical protein n=1 Tax=Alkalilimnicola sp. S0819 TaxID=2613922 RepID=UPI00126145DE|nr:hypothetical protein [Alkalilimnicola sp. S0819]KAB7627790.1 hypothetical protein F3N43_02100 [Alkalilimnicola sp. S0819]MPQ15420.1 hypothetical protein [Alkalilimnicola sp. S0819]